MEMFELLDKMAQGLIPVPEPPKKPRSRTAPKASGPPAPVRDTFDDLLEILRACPAENLPATPESATAPAPDPPPENSSFILHPSSLLGTPRAKSWDDAWLETVNAAETRIGRRICGARTIAGKPCEFGSTHHTGRCRFHGGFDLTGAPPGNRHAYIHGLYSRRLKTCGDHCPQWATCPMVQPDVETIPLAERPVCPYEEAQYNCALADALDLSCCVGKMHPFAIHVAHNIAILQVMLGRATTEMRNTTLVAETHAQSDKYTFSHEQVRPHITAMSRIGSELRKYIALLSQSAPRDADWHFYQQRRRYCRESEPGPNPEQFDYVPPDQKEAAQQRAQNAKWKARKALTRAVILANDNKTTEAIEQWRQASQADPTFTDNWTTHLRKSIKAKQRAARRSEIISDLQVSPPP